MTSEATPQGQPKFSPEPGRTATLKLQSHQTGGAVMVFEEETASGVATPLHLHHTSDEVVYVLSGEVTVQVGAEVTRVSTGECAFVPRGVAHAWKNSGADSSRALFVYSPAHAGSLYEALAATDGNLAIDGDDIEAFLRQHDLKIVGPEPF